MSIRKSWILVSLLSLALANVSCGPSQSSSSAPSPAPQPAPAAAPAASPTASAPAAATMEPVDGDIPGIRVAIRELKRSSSAVTLKFTMYNDSSDKEFSLYGKFNENPYRNYANVSAIHLIDGTSKKKYFVVADSDNACLCSDNVPDIGKKSEATLWAKFPPLPDDVQKVTVQIPHFVPFEDVPVTR